MYFNYLIVLLDFSSPIKTLARLSDNNSALLPDTVEKSISENATIAFTIIDFTNLLINIINCTKISTII